ncbi:response regulator transcription factor [Haloarchaeobius litoreus]|uniref:Response regulator transcription factor n=1 Tax=Haloarchaeobius litoreus TaxID=755306 RepID=A0ABD6DM33_9EURY|nr:response regulator [Haloarchaeobius litoreus]
MPRPTILVVDDEERLADLYATWLSDAYRAAAVYGGEAALDAVTESVDIVLLDRRMPDLTGDEVLERLRADGYEGWVVMVTAVDPGLDLLEMDVHDYLTKPVSRSQLVRLVESLRVRNRFDDSRREHEAVSNKLATLDDELDAEDLAETGAYEQLESRLREVGDELAEETAAAEERFESLYSED